MIKCENCGAFFTEPDSVTESEKLSEFMCRTSYDTCPHCGSKEIIDVYECTCGEPCSREYAEYCDTCKEQARKGIEYMLDNFLDDEWKKVSGSELLGLLEAALYETDNY